MELLFDVSGANKVLPTGKKTMDNLLRDELPAAHLLVPKGSEYAKPATKEPVNALKRGITRQNEQRRYFFAPNFRQERKNTSGSAATASCGVHAAAEVVRSTGFCKRP